MLALAMRGGSMGAWSRNLVTNEVWWSQELEDDLRLEPGGFSRTEAGFFEFVHPEDRAAVRRAVDDAVEERTDYIVEFRFHHADGEWRWMEGRGRAVYEEDGTPRKLYGIGIDVTGPQAGGNGAARGEARGRIRQPAEGPVPGDAVARAAHAAQRDPRLRPHAADQHDRRRTSGRAPST